MTFSGLANPLGLLGLLTLPVILALHLLRERRRRMVVSSLERWQFLEVEVRGSRLQRIPLNWLLVCDLLIAALFSLALAQPQLETTLLPSGGRHLFIVLDVSTSMRARDVLPDRFSLAKSEATTLLAGLGPGDRATVVTFAGEPQWLGDTREEGTPELIARVAALEAGGTGQAALDDALVMALAAHDASLPAVAHILTDAAFSQPALPETEVAMQWHLFGRPIGNQAVVAIGAETVDSDEVQVVTQIGNFGSSRRERIVTLRVDGAAADSVGVSLGPDEIVTQSWTVRGRPALVSVELAAGDELPEDDSASLGLHSAGQVRVALVAADPQPFQRALEAIQDVDLQVMPPEQYRSGLDFDLVVFRQFLPPTWPDALIVIADPPERDAELPVEGVSRVSGTVRTGEDPIFHGADFGSVRWSQAWRMGRLPESFKPVLRAGDTPLITRGTLGNSRAYLLLADLRSGNFTRHPAFPILISNLVASATSRNLPPQLAAGAPFDIPSAEQFPQVSLQMPGGERQTWGADRRRRWVDTVAPGPYLLEATDLDGSVSTYAIGVNAGNAAESDVRPRDWGVEEEVVVDAASASETTPVRLASWLLALALLLLIVEARLAWR